MVAVKGRPVTESILNAASHTLRGMFCALAPPCGLRLPLAVIPKLVVILFYCNTLLILLNADLLTFVFRMADDMVHRTSKRMVKALNFHTKYSRVSVGL